MFNPFIPFITEYLNRFIQRETNYFVTQSYHRAYDHFADHAKTNLLITEYDDYGLAIGHLRAIKNDKYAAVIDITKPKHLEKFQQMLQPESTYRLWWSVIEDKDKLEKRLNEKYKEHMRRYIDNHTDWRVAGDEKIKPKLEVIFGELFITLKRGSNQIRIKFEEIEKA